MLYRKERIATLMLLLLTIHTASANTGGGCVVSPEVPSAVLALIGGAVAAWRARRKR